MDKLKKRNSIQKKIQKVVLLISVTALLVSTVVGISGMLHLRGQVLSSGIELGETAAMDSEQALLEQSEQNLLDIVSNKANLADAKLDKFSNYVEVFSSYIDTLYQNPDRVLPEQVLPPDAANKDILAMQRNLVNTSVAYEDVADEIALLGNVRQMFDPVIRAEKDMISTIYLGTESGILLSYDTFSHTADTGKEEEYFNFWKSAWYLGAKEKGALIFTDTYQDGYGRGLTVSCAAPFYQEDGTIAGVVCMDILISDLNQSIINIDLGEDAYAFLLGRMGDVIASPYMEKDAKEFDNVTDPTFEAYSVSKQLMSGDTGFIQGENSVYYAYTPITASDWSLVIHVPAQRITAPADITRSTIEESTHDMADTINQRIFWTIAVITIAFVLIICAIISFSQRFARRLTKPLMELNEGVKVVSSGKLDYFIDIHTGDELETLANSFNKMTKDLLDQMINLKHVTAEKERIGAELGIATHIQASMLPCIFPAFPERAEFDIYASMQPAKEVGGDFYDFFLVDDNHLAMVMADVSGKGVPAALFMVIAKTLIKNITQTGLGPKEVLEKVNNQLCENNDAEMFVTVWLGVLEIATGKMICANAGHEFPTIKRVNGDFELIRDKHGFVLAGLEGSRYQEYELSLNEGDRLFVYTDGVAEATNAADELYGTGRMIDALNQNKSASCEEMLHHMKEDIDLFVGEVPQFDDITMLTLEMRRKSK